MKFIAACGLNLAANGKLIQEAAMEADRLGFFGFVMPDHYMWGQQYGPGGSAYSTLEAWTALT